MRLPYFMQGAPVIDRGRLRLALPWLAAAVRAEPHDGHGTVRQPAAEWLLARAKRGMTPATDWRRWLTNGSGLADDVFARLPAGPCVHAARHGVLPFGIWACARPVHLLAGLDHLQMSPAGLSLEPAEVEALGADINRHLEGTQFRLHPSYGADWLLECAEAVACTTVEPDRAAGGNLSEFMPGGPDGARLRSLMNELQMLLHEHPVNERRAQRGEPAVNSLWLWGFGSASSPAAAALPLLFTDDAWLEGLWRAHGVASRPLTEFEQGLGEASAVALGWSLPPARDSHDCLARSESQCFAPARTALVSGQARCIDLLAGELSFTATRRSRMLFWRRARPLAEVLA